MMPTTRSLKSWLWRFGPAAVVMALIFFASAQPRGVLPDYGANDWGVKKAAHVLVYAVLAVAYLHALAAGRRPTWRQATTAVVLAGLYGATDEFHQAFVAGRGAGPVDVAIDTLGAALGVALGGWVYRRFTRTPTPPAPLPSIR
ncbi:MAG: VanZ family protein [Anaerolineales bacterium]|nr:VanZ family protein [Anaerolineales bacterium]